jgi:hypothetical protein
MPDDPQQPSARSGPMELIIARADEVGERYHAYFEAGETQLAALCADEIASLRAIAQDMIDDRILRARQAAAARGTT